MKNIPYSIHENYVLRTPSLPFTGIDNISSERIKQFCRNPFVSEAIYLTSPELHAEMLKYIEHLDEAENLKLKNALLKYIVRMSSRCTPFGLFAGISIGSLSNETKIELKDLEEFNRKTRIDMNSLCALSQKLESSYELRKRLKFFPNTSLYKIGNEYRYIEFKYIGIVRHHYTISISASKHIKLILELSKPGISIEEMVEALFSKGIEKIDSMRFINNLIDNQVLISTISPTVSGKDYLSIIEENINLSWLKKLRKDLVKLDRNLFDNLNSYEEIIKTFQYHEIPFNKKFLFQTDLEIKTKSSSVDRSIFREVSKALSILNKLKERRKNPTLEGFKRAFYERYEEEEVPLSLALDVETGIGYDQNLRGSYDLNPLIDDLIIFNKSSESSEDFVTDRLSLFIKTKIDQAKREGLLDIKITDEEMIDFPENWDDLPDSFPLIFSLHKDKYENQIIYISHVGGQASNYYLGRFGHINSNFENLLHKITAKDRERKNSVLAEIVHLPESRTGNVLYRCNLRNYEIPYLAKSHLNINNQISISDIFISLVNNKILLRSKSLNKYIEPRLANAHFYSWHNTLPVYHLLCDLQKQDLCPFIDFTWGKKFANEKFLPRIKYKNVIISRAEWRFRNLKLNNHKSLLKWKEENDIPDIFFLTKDDNELYVNLKNKIFLDMFLQEVKNKPVLIIKECLSSEFENVVNHKEDRYANEFMFFLSRKEIN